MQDILLRPLDFALTRAALVDATLLGIACGLLGVFVILRGLQFIGDALSHCVVPGVALAYLAHGDLELWGGVAAVGSALGIGGLIRRGLLRGDTAIAVVFTSMFAIGLAIISETRSYLNDLTEILFGQILAITVSDVIVCGVVTLVVCAVLARLYWPLLLASFDPVGARAQGLPVELLDLVLYALIALTVVPGFTAVGSLLVTALLIVPAASARLLARSVFRQMLISAALAIMAGWLGVFASYFSRVGAGGAIVLVSVVCFTVTLLLAPRQGLLARRLAARSSSAEPT